MFREGISKNYALPDPRTGLSYFGRGYVQLTWYDNYLKEGIAKTPEKAMEPKFLGRADDQGHHRRALERR